MEKIARRLRQTGIAALAFMLCGFGPNAFADTYELGLKMYAQGDYAMAARYFREATSRRTDDPNIRYYLADSYLKLNRLSEAQVEYQKILALAPGSQAARLSQIGLSHLQDYLNNGSSERWSKVGGSGPAGAEDRYQGSFGKDNYLDDITENGRIIRWSLAKMPLKLYIERSPQGIRNFQPSFISEVRKAMQLWCGILSHQMSFVEVNDPVQADIRVTWTNTIDTHGHDSDGGTAYTAGLTLPNLRDEQLQNMAVQIATFDIQGKPQNTDIIYAVAIHELGHSLGILGHSNNPRDIMYAQNQHVTAPSPRDINTIRKLYTEVADVNNVPAALRKTAPDRAEELAAKMDESVAKMEAQAKKDDMALTWLNLGITYFQKGKMVAGKKPEPGKPESDPRTWYRKSLGAINTALEKEPNDPRAYHRRSLIHQELNEYPKALQDIQKAISFDRKEPEYYMLQSWYLAKLGQNAQARSALDTYLLYKPDQANSPDVTRIKNQLLENSRAHQ